MRTQWGDGLGFMVLWEGKRNLFFHSWGEDSYLEKLRRKTGAHKKEKSFPWVTGDNRTN